MKYIKPELEILFLEQHEIIRTSLGDPGDTPGGNESTDKFQ